MPAPGPWLSAGSLSRYRAWRGAVEPRRCHARLSRGATWCQAHGTGMLHRKSAHGRLWCMGPCRFLPTRSATTSPCAVFTFPRRREAASTTPPRRVFSIMGGMAWKLPCIMQGLSFFTSTARAGDTRGEAFVIGLWLVRSALYLMLNPAS